MKVLCELHYSTVVEVEIPENLDEEEARNAAIRAVNDTNPYLNAEWNTSTYFVIDPENHNETREWFDLG